MGFTDSISKQSVFHRIYFIQIFYSLPLLIDIGHIVLFYLLQCSYILLVCYNPHQIHSDPDIPHRPSSANTSTKSPPMLDIPNHFDIGIPSPYCTASLFYIQFCVIPFRFPLCSAHWYPGLGHIGYPRRIGNHLGIPNIDVRDTFQHHRCCMNIENLLHLHRTSNNYNRSTMLCKPIRTMSMFAV